MLRLFRRQTPLFALALTGAALLVPAGAQAQGCANANVRPAAGNLDEVRDAVLCLHNRERARRGLPSLRENAKLRTAAARHSDRMVDGRYFNHVSPGGSTMMDRIRATGYLSSVRAWSVGENIAWGTGRLATAEQITEGWMRSAGHRANILNGRFREIGIGVKLGVPTQSRGGATHTATFGFRR